MTFGEAALRAFAMVVALAAAAAGQAPAFAAASVKPVAPPAPEFAIRTDAGGVTLTNAGLDQCIVWAYGIETIQLSGPDWMPEARYDVSARTAGPADDEQLRLMMRGLLEARFGLKLHHELKDTADYTILVDKDGPKFHAPGPRDASQFQPSTSSDAPSFTREGTILVASHVSLADLGEQLSQPLQRPILDRTGLRGRYDIRLDVSGFTNAPGDTGNGARLDPIAIIFNALPQQLGLRLKSGKDPVDFLVIDSLNRTPAGN